MTLHVGTRFEYDHRAPWGAPCAACGRAKPSHYVTEGGRKRLVRCADHRRRSGVERETLRCRVTAIEGEYLQYIVEERVGLQDAPPWNPLGQRVPSGGMMIAWFRAQMAAGAFRPLPTLH